MMLGIMKTSSGSTWYGDNLDQISWSREGYDPNNTIGIIEKDMLSFLDALTNYPDLEVKELTASVLEIVRSMEPLDLFLQSSSTSIFLKTLMANVVTTSTRSRSHAI